MWAALVAVLVTLVCVTVAGDVAAAPTKTVDLKTRAAARKLGIEGIHLFGQKKYAEALDKFDRANGLLPAPTLGVRAARCLEKLGRLVEAAERYREVGQFELDRRAPFVHRRAKLEANNERAKLMPRIPSLEIAVSGPRGDGITVLLDNEAVPEELIDASQPVDPGNHEVRVRRADVTVSESMSVKEGTSARLTLILPALPPPPPPPPPPVVHTDWFMWSMAAFGVGAGGIVAGVVNGGIALSKQADLEERCPERTCPPEAHGAADVFDALRYATTVGFVIGSLGLVGGTVLLVISDSEEDKRDAPVTFQLRPGGAGMRLRF